MVSLLMAMVLLTAFNYYLLVHSNGTTPPPTTPPPTTPKPTHFADPPTKKHHTSAPQPPSTEPLHAVPTVKAPLADPGLSEDHAVPVSWFATDAPDLEVNKMSYDDALRLYKAHLKTDINVSKDKIQETDSFVDVPDPGGHGIGLPHDVSKERTSKWRACDPGNTSFSTERDNECTEYLSDLNNMRAIKAQPSYLKDGRTLKFRIFYHHGNLTTIVKVSQKKFFYEAASEYLAYSLDRVLGFRRVPPTAAVFLPVDYMKAAAAIVSVFYTHWFDAFIPTYELTQGLFEQIDGREHSQVAVQLWMYDVHSALMGYLAVNYEQDDYFYHKFYDPEDPHKFPPRPHRLTAIGDLCDRFIFDFIIGNTDRGMNDHNNFVYGGCDKHTACHVPADPSKRTKGPAKYAFIDHGSSFYSHKEPEGSPFTGNETTKIIICRFRRSTYDMLKRFVRTDADRRHHIRPLVDEARQHMPKDKHFFNIVHLSVFKVSQDRLEKVVHHIDQCVKKHGHDKVFVL
jgi:hypothetical protein